MDVTEGDGKDIHYFIQECKKCTLLYKVEYGFKLEIKVIKK